MSKLKAAEQMHQVASEERQEEMQMRSALEQQISQVINGFLALWLLDAVAALGIMFEKQTMAWHHRIDKSEKSVNVKGLGSRKKEAKFKY